MNEFILCAMDRENRTEAELRENEEAAYDTAYDAYDADVDLNIAEAAADVALVTALHGTHIEYHINRYFKISGEDRVDYEKALNAPQIKGWKDRKILKEAGR